MKRWDLYVINDGYRLKDPVTGALIAATIGTALYSSNEQKKAQSKAQDAQRTADLEARRIQAERKPMEESATLMTNTGLADNTLGSLGLMVEPNKRTKTTGGLGTTGTTAGLGFGV